MDGKGAVALRGKGRRCILLAARVPGSDVQGTVFLVAPSASDWVRIGHHWGHDATACNGTSVMVRDLNTSSNFIPQLDLVVPRLRKLTHETVLDLET